MQVWKYQKNNLRFCTWKRKLKSVYFAHTQKFDKNSYAQKYLKLGAPQPNLSNKFPSSTVKR